MKIAAIRAMPVLIPLEAPYVWSYGVLDGFTKTIIEVETSDGMTGIGEAPSHAAAARLASTPFRLIVDDDFVRGEFVTLLVEGDDGGGT